MIRIEDVDSPADLKRLTPDETLEYCDALRQFLIEAVTSTGGHLGSNLGVVELTVALHRVFDFAKDRLVLDTSHQVYPHKVITGRRDRFPTLRRTDGLSGFMAREESPYDSFTSGHAGTAVSVAAGLALADQISGRTDRHAIAVVGDAAAGAGATFEALNHAGHGEAGLLVVLNDNQWSIARTVGALRKYLSHIRAQPAYRASKKEILDGLRHLPLVGEGLGHWVGQVKEAVANYYLEPGHLFRDLGWTYFGPENGHDVARLETILEEVRLVPGPVLLHVVTEKGRGAPEHGSDAAHAVKPRSTAKKTTSPAPSNATPAISYSDAFGRAVARAMELDPSVVALTAAMPGGTGLTPVTERFPERVIDVGICEQHGVAVAAALADSGLKPVVAIYSTFLQRGYDQIWQEVVVQGLPVIFAMDRAGIVGGDGVTHQGLYDIAYLRTFPDVALMAPADPPELETMLRHALTLDGPSGVRYPRGSAPDAPLPGNDAPVEHGRGVLLRPGDDLVLLVYGSMVPHALRAADLLADAGVSAAVWNARFARPLDAEAIRRFAIDFPLLITVEEHTRNGGFGSAVLEFLAAEPDPQRCVVRVLGTPDQLIPHGEAADWLARFGLDAPGIASRAQRELAILQTA